MYIFKNAFISITRNKGRNILIGIIILVIASAASVSLAIRNTANSLIKSYEDSYSIEATIGFNRQNMMNNFDKEKPSDSMEDMKNHFNSVNNLSFDEILNYANSNYIDSYYYTISTNLSSNDIETVSVEFNGKGGKNQFSETNYSNFLLIGYSSYEAMVDFISGNYTITDGNIISDLNKYECVINYELASLNDINVGDIITFYNEENNYEFEVVGIYQENNTAGMQMFSNSANQIITGSSIVQSIDSSASVNPTFIIKNEENLQLFEKELYEKGMSEYLSLSTNLDTIKQATSSITNVSNFATTFLIITLVIGTTILLVINMINIRERKYEIGVLRAIGMKKSKLMGQFIIELLMVALVFLLVGGILGSFISKPISNNLLQNEIESSNNQKDQINNNFGSRPNMDKINGVVTIQAFDEVNAVVDSKVILQLIGIGILLTLIGSIAAIANIQKFSPLDILKERS